MFAVTKTKITILVLCGFILFVGLEWTKHFSDWDFKGILLRNTRRVICYFSFFGLIFCGISLLNLPKALLAPIGTIWFLIFLFIAYTEIYPIDTTTKPVDFKVLDKYGDGKKLILRKYKKAKTEEEIQDTVLVRDVFIFRHYEHR